MLRAWPKVFPYGPYRQTKTAKLPLQYLLLTEHGTTLNSVSYWNPSRIFSLAFIVIIQASSQSSNLVCITSGSPHFLPQTVVDHFKALTLWIRISALTDVPNHLDPSFLLQVFLGFSRVRRVAGLTSIGSDLPREGSEIEDVLRSTVICRQPRHFGRYFTYCPRVQKNPLPLDEGIARASGHDHEK